MISWLNIFKHLLPNARAWRLTVDKRLRQFFDGLSGIGESTKTFLDGIYNDIDPQKTRELNNWELQFSLPRSGLAEQQRRDRLEATWKALGGQDPRYIQDTLQAAGFDVYVHEWWEPIPGRPNGGSINGDVTPVARNPFDYLDPGTSGINFLMVDGAVDAQDGDPVAQDGSTAVPPGYALVNKIIESVNGIIGDGSSLMQDGNSYAQDGSIIQVYRKNLYPIPADPTKYPFFLYIGGATFPNQANLPVSRREEFEDLCLKICPTEQWLGILVTYS